MHVITATPPSATLEQREQSDRARVVATTGLPHERQEHQQQHRHQQQQHPDDENDIPELQVRVVTTLDDPYNDAPFQTIDVRLEELHRREEEMLHVARAFAVPLARWNGSRLYKYYRAQRDANHVNPHSGTDARRLVSNRAVPLVVTLDPTAFCHEQHLSSVFVWKPWLGEMLQSYMRTGVLNVHRDATGDDWLICCEYFGILYQPSQVVFETLQAYQNVSTWSEYLSQRCELAEWVAERVLRKQQTVFVVSHQDEGWAAEVDQHQSPASMLLEGKVPGLSDFFHDDDHPVETATRQVRMRRDFCGYMEHVLSHVQCRFDMELVTLTAQVQRYAPRAVIRIRLLLHPPPPPPPKKSRQDLPFPVDEMVAEDLQHGTLEKLVQQVDARNAPMLLNKPNLPKSSAVQITPPRPSPTTKALVGSGVEPPPNLNMPNYQMPRHGLGQHAPLKVHPGTTQEMRQKPRLGPTGELPPSSIPPHLVDGLPFNIIRTHSNGEGNQSVTSALTGPYFYDEDGSLKDTHEYHHDGTGGGSNWWNRDMTLGGDATKNRVKALLDDATTDVEASKGDRDKSSHRSSSVEGPQSTDDHWEWLTTLCQYPTSLLAPPASPSSKENQRNASRKMDSPTPDAPASSTKANANADDPKRNATLLALQSKAAEVRSQKIPTTLRPDSVHEELRVLALHTDDEAEQRRNAPTRLHEVTPGSNARTPSPRTPESPAESSVSSEDVVDKPEPAPRIRNRAGYESQASSTVSSSIKLKITPSSRESKLEGARKRPVLKGLFRRRRSDRAIVP